MFNLPTRVSGTIIIILASALGLTLVLDLHKFDRAFSGLLESRFQYVLDRVRDTVELEINLGLPLAGLRSTAELLNRVKARDPQILSVDLFDQNGTVLFSTDPTFINDLVSERWMALWADSAAGVWTLVEEEAHVVGLGIRSNLGEVTGAIALRYSRSFYDATIAAVASALLKASVVILIVAALLSALASWLLLRPVHRRFLAMEKRTRVLARGSEASGKAALATNNIDPLFDATDRNLVQAVNSIEGVTRDIRRLDELT